MGHARPRQKRGQIYFLKNSASSTDCLLRPKNKSVPILVFPVFWGMAGRLHEGRKRATQVSECCLAYFLNPYLPGKPRLRPDRDDIQTT
jgi:hypothetical protein